MKERYAAAAAARGITTMGIAQNLLICSDINMKNSAFIAKYA
jgi:hypothetical protein